MLTSTEVHIALCRLLSLWGDDPDKLAVAARAWLLAGYAEQWAGYEVDAVDGHERIAKALYRRNRRVLRNRAEGLLLALEAEAADANRARLHDVQERAAVIECRRLPLEERIARLRELETAPPVKEGR